MNNIESIPIENLIQINSSDAKSGMQSAIEQIEKIDKTHETNINLAKMQQERENMTKDIQQPNPFTQNINMNERVQQNLQYQPNNIQFQQPLQSQRQYEPSELFITKDTLYNTTKANIVILIVIATLYFLSVNLYVSRFIVVNIFKIFGLNFNQYELFIMSIVFSFAVILCKYYFI
jgi:hypothetical protein